MTSRFSRFLHLERSRGERPKQEEPSRLEGGSRFEAIAQRGEAPQADVVPEAHLERFRGQAPLALAEQPAEEQRFPRCARCESDNSRFAQECAVCGADLSTPQQREYNERLWQARQQELAREREAVEAIVQNRQRSSEERQAEEARYAALMAKLREQEGRGSRWEAFHTGRSLGLSLLALIPHPLVRWGVAAVSILVPVLLWRYGATRAARSLGMYLTVIALVLFVPRRARG
ncbi:MAG: hypothetical protein JXB05_36805 [Myxococcaceae bacterium]|nr:hypothetical protein [Myxococcaceae bacterium]